MVWVLERRRYNMDIRDIREQAPLVDDKQLEEIYNLQKNLMEGYIGKIEKDLPMYPIDVNSRKVKQYLRICQLE